MRLAHDDSRPQAASRHLDIPFGAAWWPRDRLVELQDDLIGGTNHLGKVAVKRDSVGWLFEDTTYRLPSDWLRLLGHGPLLLSLVSPARRYCSTNYSNIKLFGGDDTARAAENSA